MLRSWGNQPLSAVLGLTCAALLLGTVGGCHAILGLDKYEKGDASGGQGGGDGTGGQAPTGGAGGDTSCMGPDSCDDKNDCTEDICSDSGECENRTKAAGEECPGGVCNGRPGQEACQRCVDDQPGSLTDAGCSDGAPQCRTDGKIQCVGCEKHGDCNDNNPCTIDACSASDGSCDYRPVAAGEACDGGVCNGLAEAEACIECVDSEEGSAIDDGCDVTAPLCSDGGCQVCVDNRSGKSKDQGCTDEAPICTGSGCAACRNASDCTAPNDECATVACEDGSCVVTLDDARCESDDGCPGTCEDSGCDTTALTGESELIEDGSFENIDESPWYLAKSVDNGTYDGSSITADDYNAVFVTSESARDGTIVARFQTDSSVDYDAFQKFDRPSNTKVLIVSGYYRSGGPGPTSDNNFLTGAFYNYDEDFDFFHDYFMTTRVDTTEYEDCVECSVSPVATEWARFERRITDFSNFQKAGTGPRNEVNLFGGTNNEAGTYYEIDDLSIRALFCE